MSTPSYLFKSKRLGFRNWLDTDLPSMASINADEEVMKYFPRIQTLEETRSFMERMRTQFEARGYCYFAVDLLEKGNFIGFIGMSFQDFKADFTPCVDIGWRLDKKFWRRGYATEGARACLKYGLSELQLKNIHATAPEINQPSVSIMKKIGLIYQSHFNHPKLPHQSRLQRCVHYKISPP